MHPMHPDDDMPPSTVPTRTPEAAPPDTFPPDAMRGEAAMLARMMAGAYTSYVRHFERHYNLSREDAQARAREAVWTPESWAEQVDATPPEDLSWHTLEYGMGFAPETVHARWDRMKGEARDELASGARGATVVRQDSPWERAQYLAVRQGFIEEWRPRGGLEMALIDQLAQTYTGWMGTLRHYELLAASELNRIEREVDRDGCYRPPTEYRANLEDRALQTADRFQRMFMRSLRALRDLRRYAPQVTIHNAGQVNIGEKQINTTSLPG